MASKVVCPHYTHIFLYIFISLLSYSPTQSEERPEFHLARVEKPHEQLGQSKDPRSVMPTGSRVKFMLE